MGARRSMLSLLGPGILVAATGVGAGDLAGASFAGSHLGLAVLWAVLVGAAMKLVITENLARWQIATGSTILEGALIWLGRPVQIMLALYILPWTFFTGAALISACGVTAHSLAPAFEDAVVGKWVFGGGCSLVGVVLVWLGGFKLFERVMAVCVGVMVAVVVVTAVLMRPSGAEVVTGLVVPRIPDGGGEGLAWTLTLIGGVGGTLTVICYSYWMREAGRDRREDLGIARVDAVVGYSMTALFGIAMVIIASGVEVSGGGTGLIVGLADQLGERLGPAGRVVFLLGAFAAVFSSLLGVWQAVPYVYADFWQLRHGVGRRTLEMGRARVDTKGGVYRLVLLLIASVPMLGLVLSFKEAQKYYAVYGALFLPGLALVLIILNSRRSLLGELRNGWVMTGLLAAIVVCFLVFALMEFNDRFGGLW
jgi:Mn2+/Fe2+ NRAMP family transporter